MIASGNTSNLDFVNILFAITFFLGRVIIYGLSLLLVLNQDTNVFSSFDLWQLAPLCTCAGYGLNCWWFKQIVSAAVDPPSNKAE